MLKIYQSPFFLLAAILLGAITGYALGPQAMVLKPAGDIFLNLMLCIVVPLIFFSIASAIASMKQLKQLGKIIITMLVIFILMGTIAAIYMIIVVKLFPPGLGITKQLSTMQLQSTTLPHHFVNLFSVADFPQLFSHDHILALIIFAMLVGTAASACGEKGKSFAFFLQSGTEVFFKVVTFIMWYAPIGFFAYFAVLFVELGPQLMGNYFRAGCIYYVSAMLYFVVAFTGYAYLANPQSGIRTFWKNILPPMITAFATCSSAASIPVNLAAAKNMKIAPEIFEIVIPIGSIIHKQGSILGGIVKISFLFSLFHLNFAGTSVLITATIIAILVGTVMGAIPSGGMLGELLIISAYGFPPAALMMIAAISIIIDPPATMLNVTGNTISCFIAARWRQQSKPK